MDTLDLAAKFLAITALALFHSASYANDSDDEPLSPEALDNWSKQFYQDSSKFCSVAEIRQISLTGQRLDVDLSVERQSRQAISSMESTVRDAWLALHCPSETESIWTKTRAEFDIRVAIPDIGRRLSCRAYHEAHGVLRQKKKQSVLDKIASLLKNRVSKNSDGQ